MTEQSTTAITIDDVEILLTSGGMDPTMVRWLDTGEIETVPGVLFSDISYSGYNREYDLIVTASDLRQTYPGNLDEATDEDYEAIAEYLNAE